MSSADREKLRCTHCGKWGHRLIDEMLENYVRLDPLERVHRQLGAARSSHLLKVFTDKSHHAGVGPHSPVDQTRVKKVTIE